MAILDSGGYAAFSDVIDAFQFILKNGQRPAVISQSFGGDFSETANEAIQSLMQAGFISIVAAGNDEQNCCTGVDKVSPASAPNMITVGSSSRTDSFSSFSNYGPCVSISAPGEAVISAWRDSDTSYSRLTGTSQATPAVAGAVALYLARNPQATQQQ
jgi:subtilisin family serine protease